MELIKGDHNTVGGSLTKGLLISGRFRFGNKFGPAALIFVLILTSSFEVHAQTHVYAVGVGVPRIPGPISGPANIQAGGNSGYSISAVSRAASYYWHLNPSTAGTISGTNTSAYMTRSATFTRTVDVIVPGVNDDAPKYPGNLNNLLISFLNNN